MKDVIKYIILEQLITEGRLEDAKQKYPCLPPKLVDYFSEKDPSRNNKYVDWMCKQMWDEDEVIEDMANHGSTIYSWLESEGMSTDVNFCKEDWLKFAKNNIVVLIFHLTKLEINLKIIYLGLLSLPRQRKRRTLC